MVTHVYSSQIIGGFLRYYARVGAYTYGLTDQYPPFRLGR